MGAMNLLREIKRAGEGPFCFNNDWKFSFPCMVFIHAAVMTCVTDKRYVASESGIINLLSAALSGLAASYLLVDSSNRGVGRSS